jgi:hypothetical protein
MTEKMEHFDEELGLRASAKLSADLDALFEPTHPVPPEVDRGVLEKAGRHFVAVRSSEGGRRRFRWAAVWKVAAAAAVVIFAFSLDLTEKSGPATDLSVPAGIQAGDIDLSGRVDILDAFKLARHIESAGSVEENWDINGDGLVNRDDVDIVAFAAVRLDKGIL